jgi:hypothetical protein
MASLFHVTQTDSIILYGMLILLVAMLFPYTWEYVRYKTGVRKSRPMKKVLFGWLALIGLCAGITVSPFFAIAAWLLAGLGYWWDSYIVDRLP